MIPLVTRHQSQALDRLAISEYHVPGIELMGRAGRQVADRIIAQQESGNPPLTVAVVCGKGNNGGDGFAAALNLKAAHISVHVFSLAEEDLIRGDARHFYRQCCEQSIPVEFQQEPPETTRFDWIIDAILGTGFHGELRDSIRRWTSWINQAGAKILAIDVPTGVDANTGEIAGDSIRAAETVTMGYVKVGMTLEPGKSFCGRVVAVDIGFPPVYEKLPGRKYSLFQTQDARTALPPLNPATHKHNQGKVLVLAGSRGMTGAAALTTLGALRSGAGLTITLAPESLEPV
ncbi:MAG: NAD(P)H-hydrate epimerase, partial [Fidelibacterota bacterium]